MTVLKWVNGSELLSVTRIYIKTILKYPPTLKFSSTIIGMSKTIIWKCQKKKFRFVVGISCTINSDNSILSIMSPSFLPAIFLNELSIEIKIKKKKRELNSNSVELYHKVF